jgi:hypothetical protein
MAAMNGMGIYMNHYDSNTFIVEHMWITQNYVSHQSALETALLRLGIFDI